MFCPACSALHFPCYLYILTDTYCPPEDSHSCIQGVVCVPNLLAREDSDNGTAMSNSQFEERMCWPNINNSKSRWNLAVRFLLHIHHDRDCNLNVLSDVMLQGCEDMGLPCDGGWNATVLMKPMMAEAFNDISSVDLYA